LPYWVLYGVSNFLSFVFYYLIPYRKSVVLQNLKNSFPSKSDKEVDIICRKFYNHLCDLIVESVKLFSISEKTISKRFIVNNPEVLQPYFDSGKSIIIVGGHYNNWEMLASGIDMQVPHQSVALYSKLSNAFFNEKMKSSRGRFGLRMVTTKDSFAYFKEQTEEPRMTIFGADQSPTYSKNVHWTKFLSQDTAVALGTERFAKKYDLPVVYGAINKEKRGHYSLTISVLTENPKETKDGEITELHTKKLEEQILTQPEYWLWTHKRWKRVRED
ncbi:MAG: lysophospholipid acyltransferase family protein, partial [Bacteroidia bacterium]